MGLLRTIKIPKEKQEKLILTENDKPTIGSYLVRKETVQDYEFYHTAGVLRLKVWFTDGYLVLYNEGDIINI